MSEKKNLQHKHQRQQATSEHCLDKLLSTMALSKHESSNETTIRKVKSIFSVSQDDVVLIFTYSMPGTIVCTENRKTVSVWLVLIFELQLQDETGIYHQLSFIKSKDIHINITNIKYQYCKQYGLIINYITFNTNSVTVDIITMTEILLQLQLIHIFVSDIQLFNKGNESQNKARDIFSQNVLLNNVLQYLKLIFMARNVINYDSIIASKVQFIPENIVMKAQAKENDKVLKERKIFERVVLLL